MKLNKAVMLTLCVLPFICITQNTFAKITSVIAQEIKVPLGGNAFVISDNDPAATIKTAGLQNWKSADYKIIIYVNLQDIGNLDLSLRLKAPGKSKIKLSVADQSFIINVAETTDFTTIKAGTIQIKKTGYLPVILQGLEKTGSVFADVSDLVLKGTAVTIEPVYVKDNKDNYFYWGRRGPSVHLGYQVPEKLRESSEWFYNEITVPEGQDIEGSYYMANGFKEGYFGIQVNSKMERRILFSVWSPFNTDDPKNIPDRLKITLLKKGEKVKTGEFGNEGSGGQSYLIYPWETGKTYKFLNQAKPDGKNNTIYTAYFFDPMQNKWLLIASFKRPETNTYLKGIHSFLENFNPATGYMERSANYNNQWIRDTKGQWSEITSAKFTGDLTARKGFRKDYAGGINEEGEFYLRNCGFFNQYTKLDQIFTRKSTTKNPAIDFDDLP